MTGTRVAADRRAYLAAGTCRERVWARIRCTVASDSVRRHSRRQEMIHYGMSKTALLASLARGFAR
ncbi:hypothetical protein GCM10020220_112120 [Nonomuraea rubra]